MRISDWSSDVCSSDLAALAPAARVDQVMCSARLVFRKKRRVPLSGSDSDAIRPWTNWMRRRPKSMRRRTGNRDAKMTKVTFISADGQNRMVEIGRAHDRTPVTNAHHVCRLLLETK